MTSVAEAKLITEVIRVISAATGVQLGRQATMVESRLKTRVNRLGLNSLEDYATYFEENREEECDVLLSMLTTHHTYFFREFKQIEYLQEQLLPAILDGVRKRKDKVLRIWTAAASRGHESYSVAMFLHLHMKTMAPDLTFKIHGTDIDPESIEVAKNGVYQFKDVSTVPLAYQEGHWVRGTGEIRDFVKAKNSIRQYLSFAVHNVFNELSRPWAEPFDIILCRNLFIYFNHDQIRDLVAKMSTYLAPHGCLLLGLSESLTGLETKMVAGKYSISTLQSPTLAKVPTKAVSVKTDKANPPSAALTASRRVRILCVDDSPSVLAIMSRIFATNHGFEVVGTAKNGLEAIEKVKTLKPDAMTLDIHMPEMDGITYLRNHYRSGHPPVVMVSSVSREQEDLAFSTLKLGASDYVEKPSLSNLVERGSEIRAKVKTAIALSSPSRDSGRLNLDKEMSVRHLANSAAGLIPGAACVMVGGVADVQRMSQILKELPRDLDVCILLHGSPGLTQTFADNLAKASGRVFRSGEAGGSGAMNLVIDLDAAIANGGQIIAKRQPCYLVFGLAPDHLKTVIQKKPGAMTLFEDLRMPDFDYKGWSMQSDVVPITSFSYMLLEALAIKTRAAS